MDSLPQQNAPMQTTPAWLAGRESACHVSGRHAWGLWRIACCHGGGTRRWGGPHQHERRGPEAATPPIRVDELLPKPSIKFHVPQFRRSGPTRSQQRSPIPSQPVCVSRPETCEILWRGHGAMCRDLRSRSRGQSCCTKWADTWGDTMGEETAVPVGLHAGSAGDAADTSWPRIVAVSWEPQAARRKSV